MRSWSSSRVHEKESPPAAVPPSGQQPSASLQRFSVGAKGEIRTLTLLLPPAPQAGASASSATFARVGAASDAALPIRVFRVIRGPMIRAFREIRGSTFRVSRVIRGPTSSQAVRALWARPAAVRLRSAQPALDPSELTTRAEVPVPTASTIPQAQSLARAQSPAPVRRRPA